LGESGPDAGATDTPLVIIAWRLVKAASAWNNQPVRRLVLALALLPVTLSPVAARAGVPPPRLGTWEGTGSHSLAVSFRLVRIGHRIAAADGLIVTLPVLCPPGGRQIDAFYFEHAGYTGPGSPPIPFLPPPGLPPIRFRVGPRDVQLDGYHKGEPSMITLAGKLLSPRTMVLSTPATVPKGCGWPTVLRFVAHPVHRVPVATGAWSGTLTAPGGITGNVQIHVTDHGRIVDSFAASETRAGCGPIHVGQQYAEFVHPDGTFAGPIGVIGGALTGWQGHFAGHTLTGTVTTPDSCVDPSKPLIATFIAHPG
jgi:hypothetical protein